MLKKILKAKLCYYGFQSDKCYCRKMSLVQGMNVIILRFSMQEIWPTNYHTNVVCFFIQ